MTAIRKSIALTHEQALAAQEESVRRVNRLIVSIARMNFQSLQKALPVNQKEYKELLENKEKVLSELRKHREAIINTKDISILEDPKNYEATRRSLGTQGYINVPPKTDKVLDLLGSEKLGEIIKPLNNSIKTVGEALGDEHTKLDQGLNSILPPEMIDRQKSIVKKAYTDVGKHFVTLTAVVDEQYQKNIKTAENISHLLTKINKDLDQLKESAQMRGGEGQIYDELKYFLPRLFVESLHKEDLQAAGELYCEIIDKLTPENSLQEKINAFKNEMTGSNKDRAVSEIEKLISELEIEQSKFTASKDKDQFAVLYDKYGQAIAQLEQTKNSIEECSALLEAGQGKEKEFDKATKKLNELSPTHSAMDALTKTTIKDVTLLKDGLNTLKKSMNRYVAEAGVTMGLPIVKSIVSMVAPVVMPDVSSGLKSGVEASAHFMDSKINMGLVDKLQTVQEGVSKLAEIKEKKVESITSEVDKMIDKVPEVDITTVGINLNSTKILKNQVNSKIEKSLESPVRDKIEKTIEAKRDAKIKSTFSTKDPTADRLKVEDSTVVATPEDGWDKTLTRQAEEYAAAHARSLVQTAVIALTCAAFPPAAPVIAVAALALGVTTPVVQTVMSAMKDNKKLNETASIVSSLEDRSESVIGDSRLKSKDQDPLYKVSLLVNLKSLDMQSTISKERDLNAEVKAVKKEASNSSMVGIMKGLDISASELAKSKEKQQDTTTAPVVPERKEPSREIQTEEKQTFTPKRP